MRHEPRPGELADAQLVQDLARLGIPPGVVLSGLELGQDDAARRASDRG